MADLIDGNGLQVKTVTEIEDSLKADFKSIYGNDINLEQNTPDGQIVGILAQAGADIRELLTDIYNSFDMEQAIGVQVDRNLKITNIQRNGATYTIQPIDITVDRTVDLVGLDSDFTNPDGTGFTVQDNAGNKFILVTSTTITAGTHTLNFRAKNIGAVLTVVGTIQTQTTIVLGVTNVNNSLNAITQGVDGETDAQAKTRQTKSRSNNSVGTYDGLLGTVLQLDGVNDAQLYQNREDSIDSDLIPAHGIWLIVQGGNSNEIALAIAQKITAGANTKGSSFGTVNYSNGFEEVFYFDRPTAEALYIKFNIKKTVSTATFDLSKIKTSLVSLKAFSIGEYAETSSLTSFASKAISDNGGGGVPIQLQISKDGLTWFDYLDVTTKDKQFTLSTSNISIVVL